MRFLGINGWIKWIRLKQPYAPILPKSIYPTAASASLNLVFIIVRLPAVFVALARLEASEFLARTGRSRYLSTPRTTIRGVHGFTSL